MKTKMFVFVIMILFTVSVSFAGDVEKFYGVWVNPEYDEIYMKVSKYIIKSDGTYEMFRSTTDKNPYFQVTFTTIDSWIDSEGNLYYKIYSERKPFGGKGKTPFYELWKLSNTGETLEREWTTWDYPTELFVGGYYYSILYRQ